MKERFIQRYINAIREYLGYCGDRAGSTLRHYIMGEYEKILIEVFDMTDAEIRAIYQQEYNARYFAGKVRA